MKRSCKDVDLRDPATVQPWVEECVTRHRRRHDFRRLLARSGSLRGAELDAAQAGDRALRTRRSVLRFRCRAPDLRRARRVTAYYGWARNAPSRRFRRVYAVDRAAKSAANLISLEERK